MITVAGYGKAVAVVNQIEIVGGIIACGVFLLLISLVGNVVIIVGTNKLGFINLKIKPIWTALLLSSSGLMGAIRHHQVCLFFYMVILFLIFFIQFAIACACLALSDDQKKKIISTGSFPDVMT